MHRRLASLLLLALVSCSSDDSGGGGGGQSCKALTQLCDRLPVSEVESACGSGYDVLTPVDASGAGPVNSCTYQRDVGSSVEQNVSVVYRCLEKLDAHQYFLDLRKPHQGADEDVSGVGDEAAFYVQGPTAATLDARKGQQVVSLQVSSPSNAPCTVAQAKAALVGVAQKTFALAE